MLTRTLLRGAGLCALPLLIAACATAPSPDPEATTRTIPHQTTSPLARALAEAAARGPAPVAGEKSKIFKGTGVLVKGQQPGGALPPGPPVQPAGGGVILNFEGADLREVIRNILGDILNENYSIDPAVGGTVTIRTSSGIPRDALAATLETLLRANGATMVKNGNLYQVVPAANAVRGNTVPQLGTSRRALPSGYSVQIVPLRYVGVREMMRLLEPFVRDAQAVRPDELRNLLILAGTERELRNLMETIDMFDIDWMAGMSVGVFTLQSVDVKTMMQELDKVIGTPQTSPLTGILRIIPIERMNALLVITPQPAYLDEAKKWIERLDKGGEGAGPQFFVYSLQNQRAERLAPLLQQAFTGRATTPAAPVAPSLAPGTQPGTIVSPPPFQSQPPPGTPVPPPPPPQPTAAERAAAAARAATGEGLGIVRNLQVVADKDNNSILIVATPAEYSVIEQALKKLDVPARQVIIEVTVAEVSLTDRIEFGVEWLFRAGAPAGRGSGGFFGRPPQVTNVGGSTGLGLTATNILAQGFVYLINNAAFPGGIQAILTLLDTYGNTKVISNPHVAALDNQRATIKVGNRIPINQQTFVGGTTNAVTSVSQYIDTGVLLQVTPHINDGGLVSLEIQAEVSNPGPANAGDAPPIFTRSVQTSLAMPSGGTMIMGGLITDTKQNSSAGLPILSRLPVIGGLFGDQTLQNDRTELVLFITPRIVENDTDIRGAIEGLRRRMENLDFERLPAVKPSLQTDIPK